MPLALHRRCVAGRKGRGGGWGRETRGGLRSFYCLQSCMCLLYHCATPDASKNPSDHGKGRGWEQVDSDCQMGFSCRSVVCKRLWITSSVNFGSAVTCKYASICRRLAVMVSSAWELATEIRFLALSAVRYLLCRPLSKAVIKRCKRRLRSWSVAGWLILVGVKNSICSEKLIIVINLSKLHIFHVGYWIPYIYSSK